MGNDVGHPSEENDNIKEHILRLEKQVMALAEMFMKENKNSESMLLK